MQCYNSMKCGLRHIQYLDIRHLQKHENFRLLQGGWYDLKAFEMLLILMQRILHQFHDLHDLRQIQNIIYQIQPVLYQQQQEVFRGLLVIQQQIQH